MSWDFFTWAAIIILIAGSLAVFIWFARDVRQIVESLDEPEDK